MKFLDRPSLFNTKTDNRMAPVWNHPVVCSYELTRLFCLFQTVFDILADFFSGILELFNAFA